MIDNNAVWPLKTGNLTNGQPELHLYPNPAQNTLNIRVDKHGSVNGQLLIMNMLGKTVLTEQIVTPDNEINISSLTGGLYIVQLKIGNELVSQKFIKQ